MKYCLCGQYFIGQGFALHIQIIFFNKYQILSKSISKPDRRLKTTVCGANVVLRQT